MATQYQPVSQSTSSPPPPAYSSPVASRSIFPEMDSKPGQPVQEEPASRAAVTASVLFYLVAALVMVMVNKWVLNAVQVPLFFLLVQLLTAVACLHLAACFGFFKIPEMRLSTCKGLTPLIAINCIGLAFNTYCLQFVDASFYQVARGLVLPFTTLLSYLVLNSKPTPPLLLAIGIVCIGFMVGVSSEKMSSVSYIGIFLGVCSSVTTAGHAIVVKRSLPVVNGSAMDLAYYSNFLSAFIMAPAAVLAETGAVVTMFSEGGQAFRTFWVGGLVTGVFGFLICIAGFVSIKVTSPVTHMISAAVRGVIQTFLGYELFGDVITNGRISGITLILAGSVLYTYLKDREMRQRDAEKKLNAYAMVDREETVFDLEDENRKEEDRALLEADEMIRDEEEREKRVKV